MSMVFAVVFVGCGAERESKISFNSDQPKSPVFFVVGGRNSCKPSAGNNTENPRGTGLYKSLVPVMEHVAAETGTTPEYFSACHYNGSQNMAFVSSWNTEIQYRQTELQVRDEILKKRNEIGADQAVVIGHSYGGWIIMSLASKLGSDESIGHLYTVDAISKVNCTFSNQSGCLSAPQDIGADDRENVASRTGTWHNYFQETTGYLHSASIAQASENVLSRLPHKDIDQDSMLWDDIQETSLSGLNYAGKSPL